MCIKNKQKMKLIAPKWLINNIAEASKNASKIYIIYIATLSYCALSIFSTSDRDLVLNKFVRLPIIDVEVPLNAFFFLSPCLSILVFMYLQFYLYKLKRLLNELTTDFAPESDSIIYPWIINFVRDHDFGFIPKLQRCVVSASLWLVMPLVLSLNVLRYVKKHTPVLTYFLGFTPIIGTIIVILFWNFYTCPKLKIDIKHHWNLFKNSNGKVALASATVLFEVILFTFILFLSRVMLSLFFVRFFSLT